MGCVAYKFLSVAWHFLVKSSLLWCLEVEASLLLTWCSEEWRMQMVMSGLFLYWYSFAGFWRSKHAWTLSSCSTERRTKLFETDLKCTEFLLNRCETEAPSLIFNVCALVSLFGGIEERACLFVTDLIRTLGMFETITSWLTTLVSA